MRPSMETDRTTSAMAGDDTDEESQSPPHERSSDEVSPQRSFVSPTSQRELPPSSHHNTPTQVRLPNSQLPHVPPFTEGYTVDQVLSLATRNKQTNELSSSPPGVVDRDHSQTSFRLFYSPIGQQKSSTPTIEPTATQPQLTPRIATPVGPLAQPPTKGLQRAHPQHPPLANVQPNQLLSPRFSTPSTSRRGFPETPGQRSAMPQHSHPQASAQLQQASTQPRQGVGTRVATSSSSSAPARPSSYDQAPQTRASDFAKWSSRRRLLRQEPKHPTPFQPPGGDWDAYMDAIYPNYPQHHHHSPFPEDYSTP